MNLDDLLDKAKWSKLSDTELAQVVQKINDYEHMSPENLYTLLHILGRAEAKQHRVLMEKFLYYPDDPMISRIALKSLCDYWGLTKNYLDVLKCFIVGVKWDEDQIVRLIAISIAGTYMHESEDPAFLKLLLEIFDNENEENSIRSTVYDAIARGMGIKAKDLPSVRDLQTMSPEFIDQEIIERARQKLQNI